MGLATKKTLRTKISTTVSATTYSYLVTQIEAGKAATLAEALDRAISRVRLLDNRDRLARATERYFGELEACVAAEEKAIAHDLASAANHIDLDKEL